MLYSPLIRPKSSRATCLRPSMRQIDSHTLTCIIFGNAFTSKVSQKLKKTSL